MGPGGGDSQGRQHRLRAMAQLPDYALLVYLTSLTRFGGLTVGGQLRVLKRTIGPWAGYTQQASYWRSGNAYCGGMLITPALSFSRWLGQNP